jgi:hypothetical protein
VDYYFHEEAILSTWDVKHERFGWMLCFGDLVWVPFTYSLQAQYLLSHPRDLPTWATLGIIVLNVLGYVVFRGTNLQKHRFGRRSRAPDLGQAGQVHSDRARHQAAGIGILGDCPAPELLRRPDDGAGVVSDLRREQPLCRTFTSSTLRGCWCTESGATMPSATPSTALTGKNTDGEVPWRIFPGIY